MNDDYTKRLDVIADNGIRETEPSCKRMVTDLKPLVTYASSESQFKKMLAKYSPTESLQHLALNIYDVLHTANALGRSNIVESDRIHSAAAKIAAKSMPEMLWIVCDDGPLKISFELVPQEALKVLRKKSIQLAGVTNEELKKSVIDALVKSAENGESFANWKMDVDAAFEKYGIDNLSSMHLQTVFRTNIFAGYSVGQWNQVQEMSDRFPLARFCPIHDSKSRHLPLEGYYPSKIIPLTPIDYNCRCGNQYLHISQITGNEQPMYSEIPRPDLVEFNQRDGM
jgi:hypothetical protein